MPAMRDTSFTTSEGTVVQQRMVSNDSKPKGLKLVLEERKLWLKGCARNANSIHLHVPCLLQVVVLAIGSVHSQTSRTKSQFYMKHWRGRAICVTFFLSSIVSLLRSKTIGDSQNSGLVPVVTTLSRRGEKLCHYLLTLFLCPPSESTSVVPII